MQEAGLTHRENILRTIRFERPESIPMGFHINAACWNHYDHDALQDLMEAHPLLFPNFSREETVSPDYSLTQRKDEPYTDSWGCVWKTSEDGITGSVHGHPLADWAAFDSYVPPDPESSDGTFPVEWEGIKRRVACQKESGQFVGGGLPHGHTFLRLQDICGYENLIFDMVDERPELTRLIGMLE